MVVADLGSPEWVPAQVVPMEFAAQQLWAERVLGLESGAASPNALLQQHVVNVLLMLV